MPVYFANPGTLDLDFVRLMGVNVKENENPIGYYGTGLKFGIATLLRTGHTVRLTTGGKSYLFTARDETIRGKVFKRVYMNDEPLAYTTDLGRNWEVWQAYRELHSNTLDENGTITDKPVHADTVIEVDGPTIGKEYADRGRIFLTGVPLAANDRLEVYEGRTPYIYYRGVRAGQLPEAAAFTYNIIEECELSEDRNFKDLWNVEYKIETNFPALQNQAVAEKVIGSTKTWDGALNFSFCGAPSKEFLAAAESHASNAEANQSSRKMLEMDRQRTATFPPCEVTERMTVALAEAVALIRPLGCDLNLDDVTVCTTLGANVHGMYHKGQDRIYVATAAIDLGPSYLGATLYEEWIHKVHKLRDKTTSMQNFLFHKLIWMAGGEDLSLEPKGDGPETPF